MRLWHKDLIPVLPDKQLLGQWRECCLIAKNIAEKGTPNHLLVNRVMEYPAGHLWEYGFLIMQEMLRRGYDCNFGRFEKWIDKPWSLMTPDVSELFADWHNDRYLMQCFYNLQEKYDCGGITEDEWQSISHQFSNTFMVLSVKQKIGHLGFIDEITDEGITVINSAFYRVGDING